MTVLVIIYIIKSKYYITTININTNWKETYMEIFKIGIHLLIYLIVLVGYGRTIQEPIGLSKDVKIESETSPSTEEISKLAKTAYTEFLSGDISMFDSTDISKWNLDTWRDTILSYGELEYTYLDLDGDGVEELLVQYVDDPSSYNGVFHYDNGRLYCWQYDWAEGSCRDYPLKDGTIVRQYDFNGTHSYTLFRYQTDGQEKKILSLFSREELIFPDSTETCPYYEVDGNEVDKMVFHEQLNKLIINQMLDRLAWISIETI